MALITSPPALPSLVSFLPDTIAIFNQAYEPVFKEARPVKIFVNEDSKSMEHPLETGATTTDHRIILPVKIDVSFILPLNISNNVFEIMRQLFLSGTLLIIQTKAQVYSNQLIKQMPHTENPDMFYSIGMPVRFEEVQFAPPAQSIVIPRDPTNSGTSRRGEQQGSPLLDGENANRSAVAAGVDFVRGFL